MDEIGAACQDAERSKAFIDMQLNPKAEWAGWPIEITESWLGARPTVVSRYFEGLAHVNIAGRALRKYLRDAYRPRTGSKPGPAPREPIPGLHIPVEVSEALDDATWDAMRKMGGRPDAVALRQAVKLPKSEDVDGEDIQVVIQSAGVVTGAAFTARYTSIRGDLYWADVRNTLELWIMARPELVTEYAQWAEKGSPRAWEAGGDWIPVEGGKVEHNPLIHIRTSAFRTAIKAIGQWRNDGTISLDSILESGGWEAVKEAVKPFPQRTQHKPPTGHQHYTWGLRDRVECYNFPVETRNGPLTQ